MSQRLPALSSRSPPLTPRSLRNLHPNQPGRCAARAELGSRQPCRRRPSGQAWTEGSSQSEPVGRPRAEAATAATRHAALRAGRRSGVESEDSKHSLEEETKARCPSLCHLGAASGCVCRTGRAGASASSGSSSRGAADRFGERGRVGQRSEGPPGVVVLAWERGQHSRQELAERRRDSRLPDGKSRTSTGGRTRRGRRGPWLGVGSHRGPAPPSLPAQAPRRP